MKRIRAVILAALMIMMVMVIPLAGAEETTEAYTEESGEVVFVNILKKGSVEVTKTAEDGLVEGISFRLYGTSDSGKEVDVFATTDKNGKIVFEDIPIGTYTLTEASVPDGYVIPEDMTVKIIHNETVQVTFTNILEKGSVQIIKVDSKNPDVKLSGAEFVIYKDANGDGVHTDEDELMGYMEEVSAGLYIYEDLPYGSYFVNETKAPEGYNLDPIFYPFVIKGTDIVTVQNRDGFFVNDVIEETLTQQPTTTPQDAPQTGQTSYVFPLIVIALVCAGVIILLIVIRRRSR